MIIAVAVIVGAAGFFGGMQYQKSQRSTAAFGNRQFQGNGNLPGRSGQNGQFPRGNGGGPVLGEILNVDDGSITVKMPDGSSKIVLLSDKTAYSKSSQGAKTDLKVGDNVGVFGTANSDGTVSAQDVQINPAMRLNPSSTPGQ